MDNPSEQPDRKSKPEAAPERANFWPPILFVGGLFIAGYVLSEIDKELLGVKGAAILIAVVIIFGPLTKCSSDESRTPTELYYRR